MKTDLYKILGVSRTASQDEIKAAYKSLAQKLHPDKSPGEEAANLFSWIQKAYSVLKDADKRRQYDLTGNEDVPNKAAVVKSKVAGVFAQFIQDEVQARISGHKLPIFSDLSIKFTKEIAQIDMHLKKLEEAKNHACDMDGLIKSDSEEDLYRQTLEDFKQSIGRDMAEAEQAKLILNAAVDKVNGYHMDGDRENSKDHLSPDMKTLLDDFRDNYSYMGTRT